MSREIELKYRLPSALADALWEDAMIAPLLLAPPQRIAMESFYYDTPSGALSAARISLRLRRENGVSCVTLKTPQRRVSALSERGEWEVSAPSVEAALPALAALGAPALPQGEFTVHATAAFVRQTAPIRISDACTAALCVDTGTLGKTPFCELELELASGDPAALCAFGARLAEQFSLTPEPRSKHARAVQFRLD